MKRLLLFVVIGVITGIFTMGCGGLKPLSLDVKPEDNERVTIIPECQGFYTKQDKAIVAVVDFADLTSASGKIMVDNYVSSKNTIGVYGGRSLGTFNVFGGISSTQVARIRRELAPQLAEYTRNTVETMLVQVGGASVVTRTKLDAVMKEQAFQMSIADPNTVVQLGNLIGAEYLITGSVDNVNINYYERSEYIQIPNPYKLGEFILQEVVIGYWKAEVESTVALIDVSTGEVISSKNQRAYVRGESGSRGHDIEKALSLTKEALALSVSGSRNVFINQFAHWGYVNEMRGGKKAALINLGSEEGMRYGAILGVYEVELKVDFATNRSSCVITNTGAKLEIASDLTSHTSWAKIKGLGKKKRQMVKVGSIVRRMY